MKIYVPQDNIFNKCYVVQGEGVIRGYDKVPSNNVTYTYRDYYINSDYIYRDGQGQWTSYSTLPICLDNSNITNDIYYRIDYVNILIIFTILVLFCIYFPVRLFLRLIGGNH